MAINGIPEVLNDYNAYLSGNRLGGPPGGQPITGNTVNAPLPGRILEIKVKVGDSVKAGQEIAVLEAMKMENSIVSDYAGTVKQILVKTGDNVQTDAALIEVE